MSRRSIVAAAHIVIAAVAALLVAASFLPLIETFRWFVRIADFPRLQLLIALVGLSALLAPFFRRAPAATGALLVGMFAASASHVATLWPYRPSGADFLQTCPPDRKLDVMVANVLLGNHGAEPVLEAVRREAPDLFLAMETDEQWAQALAPLAGEMPHTIQRITGSHYGIMLFSRLPLAAPKIAHLASQDTPAILSGVTLHSGETIDFIGMHPRPPHPGQSALGRDAQLYAAALLIRDGEKPAVVAGDLNATPWEAGIERMRRIAGLIDPRHGYGYVPTYSAKSWWQAWPLDQVFHEAGFSTMSLERLEPFGSDHYPYIARLCRTAAPGGEAPPELRDDDLREAERTIAAATGAPTPGPEAAN